MSETNGSGLLRAALDSYGGNLKDLTVLAPQNDPYRCDTAAGHRDGAWLADTLDGLGVTGQRHLRGLHYILIGQPKPNGLPYTNTDDDWLWLGKAAKAARWLQYVPFDQVVDQRNDEPVIRGYAEPVTPRPYVSVGFDIDLPDAEALAPQVGLDDFHAYQPYRLVIVGEKSSLRPVLDPVAARYAADLYLPTGEISDTQIHRMAEDGALDGRPMVVLYFADCDPAGWQMAISVSRKLQALIDLEFGWLDLEVHRVGLVPDQVRAYGLPSTPLKAKEKRAPAWIAAMGVEQTEIDALAALQPDVLTQMAADAVAPFFDATLARRVRAAASQWEEAAQPSTPRAVSSSTSCAPTPAAGSPRSASRCRRSSTRSTSTPACSTCPTCRSCRPQSWSATGRIRCWTAGGTSASSASG